VFNERFQKEEKIEVPALERVSVVGVGEARKKRAAF